MKSKKINKDGSQRLRKTKSEMIYVKCARNNCNKIRRVSVNQTKRGRNIYCSRECAIMNARKSHPWRGSRLPDFMQ